MPNRRRFETVPVSHIAHLIAGEAMPAAILSISRNRDLLSTRELILARAGYEVCSVLKIEESIHECAKKKFQLVVIGHTTALAEGRNALVFLCQALSSSGTPVLFLRRPEDPPFEGAEYELNPFSGAEELLAVVGRILRSPRRGPQGKRKA